MPDEILPDQRRRIADAVHDALVVVASVPRSERFQILTGHGSEELFFDAGFLGVERQVPLFVHITLVRELATGTKRRLYREISDRLQAAGVRSDDVFVVLTENQREDWSAARGMTHLLEDLDDE